MSIINRIKYKFRWWLMARLTERSTGVAAALVVSACAIFNLELTIEQQNLLAGILVSLATLVLTLTKEPQPGEDPRADEIRKKKILDDNLRSKKK
jgi:hypothetical protein